MKNSVSVDAHHHLWRLDGSNYPWIRERIDALNMREIARDFDAAEFREVLRRNGVARSVLVQGEPTVEETDQMLAIARENDFIAGVVGWIDLEAANAVDEVKRRNSDPLFKGLRLWMLRQPDPAWIVADTQRRGIEAAIDCAMCIDALLRPRHIPNFIVAMERYPGMRVVVCHGAKPEIVEWKPGNADFRDWTARLKTLAGKGCYMKLSGLMTESGHGWRTEDLKPYLDTILGLFGPSRTMWGSDWPVINRAGDYDRWLNCVASLVSQLSAEERAQLFGGTATEFYRL